MKHALLLICIVASSASIQAQDHSFITGSWKIVTISDVDMYLSLETDSSFLSKEMTDIYPDTASQKNMIRDAKVMFGMTQFQFHKDGTFKQTVDTMTIYTGMYKIDLANKKLALITKNSLGEDVTEKLDYDYVNDQFKFSILMDDRKLDLVLRKL